ncbi:MAG TPA: hypothetical protein VFH10_11270 [Nocardioides sp.]|uniref:hypothetical protein n=1 Tax=Nocardioides sp. TaxID=35761 RepID=UPI002D809460|nr:hypothetical protein [Nocardioides sp.]HET6653212.1 hypothetical protein [Nocardioides sp.]
MKGQRIYRIVWSGVVVPLCTVGFIAAVLLLAPVVAAVLALAVVGTSPRVVRSSLRWCETAPPTSASRLDGFSQAFAAAFPEFAILPGTPPPATPPDLPAMTDEQLCRQWRTSSTLVQEAASARQLSRVLQTRQLYLDELERRNQAGFDARLASGARAESDPLPYLRGERATGSAIDWNELTSGYDG